jgi:hypothetical protein
MGTTIGFEIANCEKIANLTTQEGLEGVGSVVLGRESTPKKRNG